jgi:CRISPR-associated protein Cmr1
MQRKENRVKTSSHVLKFSTPAFLGDAEQKGVWRTPPLKALLRQWWRVAYAAQAGFSVDVGEMRREEALLFGHAWLENDRDEQGKKVAARRSKVRLRLDKNDQRAQAPRIEQLNSIPEQYLGYGRDFKANAVIQAGESAILRLAFPDEYTPLLNQALWLMDRYGTLGGRSRNGWGSFSLTPAEGMSLTGSLPLQNWEKCLELDWPHAVGQDKQALIWQFRSSFADWKKAIASMTPLRRQVNILARDSASRHWLSYPSNGVLASDARLPNSLRFKVRPAPDNKFVGVIFHVPCLPPSAFLPDRKANLEAIKKTWKEVYKFLDRDNGLSRIPE